MNNIEALATALGKVGVPCTANEPMSRHTTFRVGGAAALFIVPTSEEQATTAQRLCCKHGVRLLPLGRGSNMLVQDSGLPFAVLHLGDAMSGIAQVADRALQVACGTSLAAVCRHAATLGLSGLEFGYGIPGSVGGAVYMNAGAYGGEMKDVVTSVAYLDEEGNRCTLSGEDLQFSYRHSAFSGRGCIILSATMELATADPAVILAAMEDYMSRRREKQPLEYGSAGSTFKRPAGAYAAALIDQCGLKGYSVGDAQVSEKHAGFVVNRGQASCADVLAVMSHVRSCVQQQTGYLLEPEIMLLP